MLDNFFENLDLSEDTADDFPPIPAGDHTAIIIATEQKATKAGTGSYQELVIEIVDGPSKGRRIWDRLNIDNPNPKAVEIAKRSVKAICKSLGVEKPKSFDDFLNKPLVISVKHTDSPQYGVSAEVKTYKKAGKPAPPPPPKPAGESTSSNDAPPW